MADEKPGYMLQIQKVTSIGSGESIIVTTNLPKTATVEDFNAEIGKITAALDARLINQNEKVLAITAATREALDGIAQDRQL